MFSFTAIDRANQDILSGRVKEELSFVSLVDWALVEVILNRKREKKKVWAGWAQKWEKGWLLVRGRGGKRNKA